MSGTSSFASYNYPHDPQNVFKYRDTHICKNFKVSDYQLSQNSSVKVQQPIYGNESDIVTISGTSPYGVSSSYVKYFASAPADHLQNFTGSGLPFTTPEQALEGTPNKGVVKLEGGSYKFKIRMPNSYYKDMGNTMVVPQVNLVFTDNNGNQIGKVYKIKVGSPIPYRSLIWNEQGYRKKGVMGYVNNNLQMRTQYQILVENGYPKNGKQAANFWGTKPPK